MQILFTIWENAKFICSYLEEFEDDFELNNYLLELKNNISMDIKHSSNSKDIICLILK